MHTTEAVNLFLRSRQAKGLSPESIRWYQGILVQFAKDYSKLPTKPSKLEDFLARCKAGDERRHGYYRAIRALYRFLHRRMDIENIIEKIDAPRRKHKEPRPLMLDELDQLLTFPHDKKMQTALLFLADTGARVGELATLVLSDLNETPWGYVARITGKTGTRIVPICVETYRALTKNLPLEMNTYQLRRAISQAFQNAHVKGTAHTLRHTFGTLWEGDELILQHIMGHAHLSTTRIYRALRTQVISTQHRQYTPLRMVGTKKFML